MQDSKMSKSDQINQKQYSTTHGFEIEMQNVELEEVWDWEFEIEMQNVKLKEEEKVLKTSAFTHSDPKVDLLNSKAIIEILEIASKPMSTQGDLQRLIEDITKVLSNTVKNVQIDNATYSLKIDDTDQDMQHRIQHNIMIPFKHIATQEYYDFVQKTNQDIKQKVNIVESEESTEAIVLEQYYSDFIHKNTLDFLDENFNYTGEDRDDLKGKVLVLLKQMLDHNIKDKTLRYEIFSHTGEDEYDEEAITMLTNLECYPSLRDYNMIFVEQSTSGKSRECHGLPKVSSKQLNDLLTEVKESYAGFSELVTEWGEYMIKCVTDQDMKTKITSEHYINRRDTAVSAETLKGEKENLIKSVNWLNDTLNNMQGDDFKFSNEQGGMSTFDFQKNDDGKITGAVFELRATKNITHQKNDTDVVKDALLHKIQCYEEMERLIEQKKRGQIEQNQQRAKQEDKDDQSMKNNNEQQPLLNQEGKEETKKEGKKGFSTTKAVFSIIQLYGILPGPLFGLGCYNNRDKTKNLNQTNNKDLNTQKLQINPGQINYDQINSGQIQLQINPGQVNSDQIVPGQIQQEEVNNQMNLSQQQQQFDNNQGTNQKQSPRSL